MTTSVEAIFNDTYDCTKCHATFKDPIHSKSQRRIKGCKGLPAFRYTIENIRYATCPGNYTHPSVSYLLEIFSMYEEKGVLPENNCIFDVTYKTIQSFGIIRSIRDKYRQKAEKDGKRNHGRNRRR